MSPPFSRSGEREQLLAGARQRAAQVRQELGLEEGAPPHGEIVSGDLLTLPLAGDLPLEWVVLEVRRGKAWVVPADTAPYRGELDLRVGGQVGPLLLRCRWSRWVEETALEGGTPGGRLEVATVEAAKARVASISTSLAAVDRGTPGYRRWAETVLAPACAALAHPAHQPSAVVPYLPGSPVSEEGSVSGQSATDLPASTTPFAEAGEGTRPAITTTSSRRRPWWGLGLAAGFLVATLCGLVWWSLSQGQQRKAELAAAAARAEEQRAGFDRQLASLEEQLHLARLEVIAQQPAEPAEPAEGVVETLAPVVPVPPPRETLPLPKRLLDSVMAAQYAFLHPAGSLRGESPEIVFDPSASVLLLVALTRGQPAGMEVAVVLSRAGQSGEPLWSGTAPISEQGEVRLAVPKGLLPPGSYSLSWAEAGSDETVARNGAPEPPRQEQYRFTVVATPPR